MSFQSPLDRSSLKKSLQALMLSRDILLTISSVASKWRPKSLGVVPWAGSILMHTSTPFLAMSTDLWSNSMDETTPISTNCTKKKKRLQQTEHKKKLPITRLPTPISTNCTEKKLPAKSVQFRHSHS